MPPTSSFDDVRMQIQLVTEYSTMRDISHLNGEEAFCGGPSMLSEDSPAAANCPATNFGRTRDTQKGTDSASVVMVGGGDLSSHSD